MIDRKRILKEDPTLSQAKDGESNKICIGVTTFLSLVFYFSVRAISRNCNATLLYTAQFTNCLQNHLNVLLEFSLLSNSGPLNLLVCTI